MATTAAVGHRHPGPARAAMTEPARRPAIAAVVSGTAITDQTAVATVAGPGRATRGVIGVPVTEQDARVRVSRTAVADE